MTRAEAFEAFLAAVVECIPEDVENWRDKRAKLRDAGAAYCHTAVAMAEARLRSAFHSPAMIGALK